MIPHVLVTLSVSQLAGIVVVTALFAGTAAVLGPRFLAWTDRRRGLS